MLPKRIPSKVTHSSPLNTSRVALKEKLRTPFLLLLIHGATSPPIACQRYPYPIASTQAVSYDHPILSTDTVHPPSAWIVSETALRKLPTIEHACASELLAQYAITLSPPLVSSASVSFFVENRIRQWHQQGWTKETIQAYLNVNSMKKVRKSLAKRCKEEISLEAFMEKEILRRNPTPIEVEDYYERYLSTSPPYIPSKVVILQLAYYPSTHHSLEEIQHDLNTLYHELQQIQNIAKRKEALLKVIQNNLRSSRYPMQYGYLLNINNNNELKIEEIPKETAQAILNTGIRELIPGIMAPPHIFTNKNGFQGIRIILVETCIDPHLLNIAEDYTYIYTLCKQAIIDNRLIDWWQIHRTETDIYG